MNDSLLMWLEHEIEGGIMIIETTNNMLREASTKRSLSHVARGRWGVA